jgi:hypothetical protein
MFQTKLPHVGLLGLQLLMCQKKSNSVLKMTNRSSGPRWRGIIAAGHGIFILIVFYNIGKVPDVRNQSEH